MLYHEIIHGAVMKLRSWSYVIPLIIVLAQPFLIASITFPPLTASPVTGKFSHGGKRITISSPQGLLLILLEINYCDGSSAAFHPSPYQSLGSDTFVYTDTKPMKRVRLITPNINFSNEHPLLVKIVSRVCTDKIPPAKLYCNHVDISLI